MKNRYYLNQDTEELVIVTESGDNDFSIAELQMIAEIEYEDEKQEDDEKPRQQHNKRSDAVSGKKSDESWRSGRRVTLRQRTLVLDMLKNGKNSKEISEEIGEDLEFTNQIIEKVKGADMNFKVERKEGFGL
ncbi:MAG: hypothetical protein WA082_04310 [Candidatus Moraniibacteriota bacterium]